MHCTDLLPSVLSLTIMHVPRSLFPLPPPIVQSLRSDLSSLQQSHAELSRACEGRRKEQSSAAELSSAWQQQMQRQVQAVKEQLHSQLAQQIQQAKEAILASARARGRTNVGVVGKDG